MNTTARAEKILVTRDALLYRSPPYTSTASTAYTNKCALLRKMNSAKSIRPLLQRILILPVSELHIGKCKTDVQLLRPFMKQRLNVLLLRGLRGHGPDDQNPDHNQQQSNEKSVRSSYMLLSRAPGALLHHFDLHHFHISLVILLIQHTCLCHLYLHIPDHRFDGLPP